MTSPARVEHPVDTLTSRAIPVLFMIGSACFAVASVPALAEVVPAATIGVTYFVGSLFFTSAAFLVAVTTWRGTSSPDGVLQGVDWAAAIIQLGGTVWFNVNTFHAMQDNIGAHEENLRVWTPDFIGSVCFLVSSYLSIVSACHGPWCYRREDRDWRVAALNLLGSVFFMAAALAAFTVPATDDLLDASLANSGTLLGAVCFFWGARLLMKPTSRPQEVRGGG